MKNLRLEEFKGTPNRVRLEEPRVTLDKRGVLYLNKLAFETFGSPAAVKLFHDENELVIALKPTDVRHRNAFAVKLHSQGSTRRINIQPFCRHHKIRFESTVLFNDIEFNTEGTMFLWLKNTINIGRR
ncbi:MAG: hypothetical protein IPL32_10225 [Chloracidobacterium sp.]|nr:hypothetical protein [Chloracidobacterium sp.]